MNPKQKIAQVMKEIKENAEINPNSKWVEFHFNTNVFGAGFLTDDEERRILFKLESEGVLNLHLPARDEEEEAMMSVYSPGEFMLKHDVIRIEILDNFFRKFFFYRFYLNGLNYWNVINPFWLIWQFILVSFSLLKWFLNHKIISAFTGMAALIAIDYSLAFRNLKHMIRLLIDLLKHSKQSHSTQKRPDGGSVEWKKK